MQRLVINAVMGGALLMVVIQPARGQSPGSEGARAESFEEFNATLERAAYYEQEGDLERAIAEARRLTQLAPENADSHFWLGKLHRERGQYEEAIGAYQRGIMFEPSQRVLGSYRIASILEIKAGGLAGQGDYHGALKVLQEAEQLVDGALAEATERSMKKRLKGALKNLAKQRESFQAQWETADRNASWDATQRGMRYFNQGRANLAEREFLNAIDLDSQNSMAHKELGKCYASRQQYNKAVEACKQAVELDPKLAVAYNNLGVNYDEMQIYEEAVKAFEKALKIEPTYTLAMTNMALTYQKIGDYAKATGLYERAVKADPGNRTAYFNLAGMQVLMKDYEAALATCGRLLATDPFNGPANAMRGDITLILGRYEEAVEAFRRALIVDPKDQHSKEGLEKAIEGRDGQILKNYFEKVENQRERPIEYQPAPAMPEGVNDEDSAEIPSMRYH